MVLFTLVLFTLLILSLLATTLYGVKLWLAVGQAPQLSPSSSKEDEWAIVSSILPLQDLSLKHSAALFPKVSAPRLSVIIPAYNEAENIQDCIMAVLNSTPLPADQLEIWVVDDQSTDETWAIAQAQHDPRLKLVAGQPRPTEQSWIGKNWACTQAADEAKGEFLLFMDADVRLKWRAIETAIQAAEQNQIDLLSCQPAILCGCLAEWLVQPLICSTIQLGFNFDEINDPIAETAFASGQFMLFRRTAYEQIGGHRAVAHQVVEDVELARRVKACGLSLRYVLGSDLAAVRMYRSWTELWEGWTKNLYAGSQRNLKAMLKLAGLMILICTTPWLGLLASVDQIVLGGWNELCGVNLALSLLLISIHYILRSLSAKVSQIPPRYWWLMGLGGVAVAAIALASVIKTETGWGWTWRGRSLKQTA